MSLSNSIQEVTVDYSKYKIIPVWLRNTYAYIGPNRIYNLNGYSEIDESSENDAVSATSLTEGGLFITGDNLIKYFSRYMNNNLCKYFITIVLPGLRDIYSDNRNTLSNDEQSLITIAVRKLLPSFHDIYKYQSLFKLESKTEISEFQVIGMITPYDIVHIPVEYFINKINNGEPISILLESTNIIIQLSYTNYDCWDDEQQKIIFNIDTHCNI